MLINSKADKNMMQLIQESRTGNDLYVMAQTYLPDTVFGQLKLSDILYQRIEKLEIEDSEKNDVRYYNKILYRS